jgi:hypothetical protein
LRPGPAVRKNGRDCHEPSPRHCEKLLRRLRPPKLEELRRLQSGSCLLHRIADLIDWRTFARLAGSSGFRSPRRKVDGPSGRLWERKSKSN